MKLVVETTGPFQVYAAVPEQWARADRPSVVTVSHLMNIKAASGELRVLGQVNDLATDEEFVKTYDECEQDVDFAVAAFVSMFPMEQAEPAPVVEPVVEPATVVAPVEAPKAKK